MTYFSVIHSASILPGGAPISIDNYGVDAAKIEQELANVHLGIGSPKHVSYRGAPSIERKLHVGYEIE
jgi:hypothetical protein